MAKLPALQWLADGDVLLVVVAAVVERWLVRLAARLRVVEAAVADLVVVDGDARRLEGAPRVARQLVDVVEEGDVRVVRLTRVRQQQACV